MSFKILLFAIVAFFCYALLSHNGDNLNLDCEPYKIEIARLLELNKGMLGQVNASEKSIDSLSLANVRAIQDMKWYRSLAEEERRKRQELENDINLISTQKQELKSKEAELNALILYLEENNKTTTLLYEETKAELVELIQTIGFKSKENERLSRRVEVLDSILSVRDDEIEILISEAEDRILVSAKKVYFEGREYDYDSELIFVPYPAGNSTEPEISESMSYRLQRLSKLLRKYDSKVALGLTGVSTQSDAKVRRNLAINRPITLELHLRKTKEFSFRESLFNRKNFGYQRGKDDRRRGVILKVLKR